MNQDLFYIYISRTNVKYITGIRTFIFIYTYRHTHTHFCVFINICIHTYISIYIKKILIPTNRFNNLRGKSHKSRQQDLIQKAIQVSSLRT